VHIFTAGTIGQRFFINKKRWENKKRKNAFFILKYKR